MSDERDTGEGLGQGTVEGAISSAVNLDNGVRDFFKDSEDEVNYLGIPLAPLLSQDDVVRLSLSVSAAQAGNTRMMNVAETELLNFNQQKSCYAVFGSERRRLEILNELADSPLKLGENDMVHETSIKYLGDILSEKGLADSVEKTISKRKGHASKAIYDIRVVVDDCRSQVLGGLATGINIWERAVIPMLLYNCETWQEMSRKSVDDLEKLQLTFLRCILAVGSGCPTPLLYSETGFLLMEFRILERKLMFLHHLNQLLETGLAKEIIKVQTELGLPGIAQECHSFLVRFGIRDINLYSKLKFKRIV